MPSSTPHQPVIGVAPVAAVSLGANESNVLLEGVLQGASGCLNLQPAALQLQCKVQRLLLLPMTALHPQGALAMKKD